MQDYRIKYYGDPRSRNLRIVEDFGYVESFRPCDDLSDFEVLVIDGTYEPRIVAPDLLRSAFDNTVTVGILNASAADAEALRDVTGETPEVVGQHVFVRRMPKTSEEYGFTVFPQFTEEQVHDAMRTGELFSKVLKETAFRPETSHTHHYEPAPPAQSALYPVGDYSMIYGSRKVVFSEPLTGTTKIRIGDNPPMKQYATVVVTAYCYRANGVGGDGKYHVIFHTKMTEVQPVAVICIDTPDYQGWYSYVFSYDATIQPTASAEGHYQVKPSAPNQGSTGNSNVYGHYIATAFGQPHNYDVLIPIKGLSRGEPTDIQFHPSYWLMVNQVQFPTLTQYDIKSDDSTTQARVNFTMPPSAGDSEPKSPHSIGHFESFNYFVFDAVEADSHPVTFDFTFNFSATAAECTSFAFWGHCNASATSAEPTKKSFTIDLVKATDPHNYDPPE